MKVVINRCFGGFGVSALALKELVKRNAKCIKSFTPKFYYGGENRIFSERYEWEFMWKKDFDNFVDIGDGFKADKNDHLVYKDGLLYQLSVRGDPDVRCDKDLIEVIEMLGTKKSSSCFAELIIVKIPDGIKYDIYNYDGVESIHEVHRVWDYPSFIRGLKK